MPPVDPAGPVPAPEPLGHVSVPRAVVHPVRPSDNPNRMHHGVLRDDGTLVESTVDDRHHGSFTYIPPDPGRHDVVVDDPREAVYAGRLDHVYGHFLLESCQRLWWAVDHPELPVVWTAEEHTAPELLGWEREILDILGVRNEIVVVTQPTRFELVHVPDAGYKYADWSHPQHIAFLAAYDGPPQQDGTKLWLSRDPAHGRGLLNRDIVERRLRDLGWTVVTFEQMPVRAQLDALARAELIAGEEASTFHNLLLLTDVTGKRFQIFRRHGPEHLSFATIGDARAVDQRFHSCSHDAVLSVTGRAVVRLAPNPAQYLSHLGVPIPAPRPAGGEVPPSVRSLNRLADDIGAKTYLQLGEGDDQAFDRVDVADRDIVDEHFSFDVRSYRDRGAQFYEVSVEHFLTWFAKGRLYDLVAVDDGHGWRDAVDTVATVFGRAAHERTVVVMTVSSADDVGGAVRALRGLDPGWDVRTTGAGHHTRIVVRQSRPRPTGRVPRLLDRVRNRRR